MRNIRKKPAHKIPHPLKLLENYKKRNTATNSPKLPKIIQKKAQNYKKII
jgi:hypothetical protein